MMRIRTPQSERKEQRDYQIQKFKSSQNMKAGILTQITRNKNIFQMIQRRYKSKEIETYTENKWY